MNYPAGLLASIPAVNQNEPQIFLDLQGKLPQHGLHPLQLSPPGQEDNCVQADHYAGLLAQDLFQSLCGPGLAERILAQVKTMPKKSPTS